MIKANDIHKSFGSLEVLKGVSLEVKRSEVVSIVGQSGAGKTTLLKYISNTENLSSFLFQNPRLLPWKTILENVTLPLENCNFSKSEIAERGEYFLNQVGLLDRKEDFPKNLSGGEKQRVAMARSFAFPSSLMLLDEAFQSQDLGLKLKLMEDFLSLSKTENKTVLLVTHDIREAICLSHRILVLKGNPNQIVMDISNIQKTENTSVKEKYISKSTLDLEERILSLFLE
jgi:NitT/TauT family transport system ATP-binding protein